MTRLSSRLRHKTILATIFAVLSIIILLRSFLPIGSNPLQHQTEIAADWRGKNRDTDANIITISGVGSHLFIPSHSNKLFGTKARYYAPPPNSNINNMPDTCQLVHLHLLVRHGTRNPRVDDVDEFQKLEAKLQKHKKSDWPQWLINWKNPYIKSEANALVEQGWRELIELAERDVERYKQWLGDTPQARHQSTWYASAESAQ
jgi:hypothetical protein